MKSVAVSQFKARCLALLEDVARTGESFIVTKRGKPIARVVPSSAEGAAHPQDTLAGTVTLHGDVIEPALDLAAWNAARGELVPARRARSKRSK